MTHRPIIDGKTGDESRGNVIGSAAIVILFLLAGAAPIRSDDLARRLAAVGEMTATGDADTALSEARALGESLPPTERLTAWEIDFHGEVVYAVSGERHLYYQLFISNSEPNAPGRGRALPTVNANKVGSDWKYVVVCVDTTSGKILWSR